MVTPIVIGRNQKDRDVFGTQGLVNLGKMYVKMGHTTSLSNPVLMDIANPHVVMICGKRGSGKSTTASVMAEELSNLPDEIRNRLTMLFFDTMGIFWTMKYENTRQEDLLKQWNLSPKSFNVRVFVPAGRADAYRLAGIPVDVAFSIRTADITASDWADILGVSLLDPVGIAIERAVLNIQQQVFTIPDIVDSIEHDPRVSQEVKDASINRLLAVESWGIFSAHGTPMESFLEPGSVNVLDISAYTGASGDWSLKSLVIGLVCKKIFEERSITRKKEEIAAIEGTMVDSSSLEKPLVWIMIDEAHNVLPREGKTNATDALIQLLREGRQPGISLILATQQPGEIHKDALTQTDIIISHHLTASADITALNSMMQSYLYENLQTHLRELPKTKGACLILDDTSEKIFSCQIRPKLSWHGGESPTALVAKSEMLSQEMVS